MGFTVLRGDGLVTTRGRWLSREGLAPQSCVTTPRQGPSGTLLCRILARQDLGIAAVDASVG